ncbi:MAG: type II toxin-antitoxin system VapC family toxin [Myxococcales bacterium]|nr:type II toxin-antitoxin system VapC family toxin [Myxococcales bacterium]
MIGIDTNLVVRVITNDDPQQARRAAELMRKNRLWLSKTVLLETEWVLRYAYGYSPAASCHALLKLVGLENLQVEDTSAVEAALVWHQAGLELADALHLASCGPARAFATFDRGLARRATRIGDAPKVRLLRAR